MTEDEDLPRPGPADCQGKLHPLAQLGLALFNEQKYWKAHEALEEAWKHEAGQARHLYRGILQAGVAYYHIQQGNFSGAIKMVPRCQRWLAPFPEICRGVNVARLRADLETALAEVRRLGPDRMTQFDPGLLKPVEYTPHRHSG
jgi:hypothetical protein